MSYQMSEPRLTTKHAFSYLEAVPEWDVASIRRAPHSLGAPSEASSTDSRPLPVKRAERCFITKSSSYAHKKMHWVKAVKKNPVLEKQIEDSFISLGIVHIFFHLNDATNLTNVDCGLHVMLDKYALFAITCSLTTLDKLINLVEVENAISQKEFDAGRIYFRRFCLGAPPVCNTQYELVALHPEHFLPPGNVLTVYDHSNGQVTRKTYVAAPDRILRESPGTDNTFPCLPSFMLDSNRPVEQMLNPFLVVLNAEIKFRRYLRLPQPPQTPLPDDVMELIMKTTKLVDLIYWKPSVQPNTIAAQSLQDRADLDCDGDTQFTRTGQKEEEREHTIGEYNYGYGRDPPGDNATLDERRDYMQYLISGRDFDLDSEDEEFLEELHSQGGPKVEGMDVSPGHAANQAAVREWQRTLEPQ